MSDIKDVIAAFETHHKRAVNVVTRLVPTINKVGLILTLLSEQHEENGHVYLKAKDDLIESVKDIAELIDAFTEDFIASQRNHVEEFERILGK